MSTLRAELLRFIIELRAAGVRISVAESLDAMNAVAAGGIERVRMREALSAALIKDEADRPAFERLFAGFFKAAHAGPARAGGPGGGHSSAASGPGAGALFRAGREAPPDEFAERRKPAGQRRSESRGKAGAQRSGERRAEAQASESEARSVEAERGEASETVRPCAAGPAEEAAGAPGSEAWRAARLRALERRPFSHYSDLEYEEASSALSMLARRFRARLGRRFRAGRAGRLDFRRTIRASIQRGGALSDLRLRARRPRHVELLVLADVSGSVRYASALMLRLVAGVAGFFRRVRCFVYVDRLAEADFEDGHLAMTPPLDLYARSDFGRVLAELCGRYRSLLTRQTVLVVLGDARNNRRPPRADLLREAARLCRAVVWLIPEERARWGAGDSAVFQYARELTALVPARNLRELETALVSPRW